MPIGVSTVPCGSRPSTRTTRANTLENVPSLTAVNRKVIQCYQCYSSKTDVIVTKKLAATDKKELSCRHECTREENVVTMVSIHASKCTPKRNSIAAVGCAHEQ